MPGGFVGIDESLEGAAQRVLAEKAGVNGIFLEQLFTFGAVDRDPRTRVISVSYYALVEPGTLDRAAQEDSDLLFADLGVNWQGETGGPAFARDGAGKQLPLALDHAEILGVAVKRLRGKLNYTPVGFQLLPTDFTLRRLQEVHETILGRPLNKDSFRRRMLSSGLLEATGRREDAVGHRPAELYKFKKRSAI